MNVVAGLDEAREGLRELPDALSRQPRAGKQQAATVLVRALRRAFTKDRVGSRRHPRDAVLRDAHRSRQELAIVGVETDDVIGTAKRQGRRRKRDDRVKEPATGFLAGLKGGWEAFTASVVVVLTAVGAVLPFAVAAAVVGLPLWWALRRRRTPQPRRSTPWVIATTAAPPRPPRRAATTAPCGSWTLTMS